MHIMGFMDACMRNFNAHNGGIHYQKKAFCFNCHNEFLKLFVAHLYGKKFTASDFVT
ncbi:hypothetical protein SCT_1639 [Sulfuricella sp. T08]|nr:hypothetical protein SCT_1639 [Sulfuricella sp. T08]